MQSTPGDYSDEEEEQSEDHEVTADAVVYDSSYDTSQLCSLVEADERDNEVAEDAWIYKLAKEGYVNCNFGNTFALALLLSVIKQSISDAGVDSRELVMH